MNSVKYFLFLMLLSGFTACKTQENEGTKWNDFFDRVQSNYCEHTMLQAQSDSLWNDVGMQMDKLLPVDMDTAVRRRLIEIKNSGIIRTFKIFHTFPDTIKHKLNQVDTFDARIVRMMHANDLMLDSLEKEKLRYLSEITNENDKNSFRSKFAERTSNPCAK